MKENWKFSELEYVRPDFEKVKENLKANIDKMKAAESFTEALSVYTESDNEINELMMLYTIVYIRHTVDTLDKFYEEEKKVFDTEFPTFGPLMVEDTPPTCGVRRGRDRT